MICPNGHPNTFSYNFLLRKHLHRLLFFIIILTIVLTKQRVELREVTDDPVEQDDDEDDYWERDGASGPLGEDEDYYGGDGQKEDGIVAEGFDQMSVRKAVERAGGAAARAVEAGEGAEGAAGKIRGRGRINKREKRDYSQYDQSGDGKVYFRSSFHTWR